MENANPSSEGSHNARTADVAQRQQRQRSSSSYTALSVASPASRTLSSQRHYEGLSRQNRRLKLRNIGFRGVILPARKISPILNACSPRSEQVHCAENDNDRPRESQRRTLYGEDLPPSPVNILQEISNSTRGGKDSPRPSLVEILEDSTAVEGSTGGFLTSWYQEASNNSSPLPKDSPDIGGIMKLREGSLNSKTPPPLSSPLAKQVKGRHKRSLNLRSTSFEAAKYIEHLESQLASIQTQLESLTSPTSTKSQSAKLRALSAESRALRQEVTEWEQKFDDKVSEEVDRRVEMESKLKAKITTLEREIESRDSRVRELEWEVESNLQRVKDTEAVEMTNYNLERRVDVLTELLAQSPTKLEMHSAASSPSRSVAQKRTPRPRSMMPRLPSSPGGIRLSLGAMPELTAWEMNGPRSDSVESDSSQDIAPDYIIKSQQGPLKRQRLSKEFGSADSGLGTSCSLRSVPCSLSRSTSVISDAPISPTAWGLPLPANSDPKTELPSRQRRMRRFPSGSCSLKPLILPTATGSISLPASAPALGSHISASRDVSGTSIDSTISFLSGPDYSSTFDTPTQPSRGRSATWTQEETMKGLEGQATAQEVPLVLEERLRATLPSQQPFLDPEETSDESRIDGPTEQFLAGRNLFAELKRAGDSNNSHTGTETTSINPASPSNFLRRRQRLLADQDITPRPIAKHLLVKSQPAKSMALTTISSINAHGLFSNISVVLSEVRRDPLQLARRIVRNAWSSQSTRFGGIGWWLLGLLFGPSTRKEWPADRKIAKEEPPKGFNWHHYSADASKARRFAQYHGQALPPDRTESASVRNVEPARATSSRESSETLKKIATMFYARPDPIRCKDCVEPQSGRTLKLWCKFSLALVLAVAVAVKDGPGTLLEECPQRHYEGPEVDRAERVELPAHAGESSADLVYPTSTRHDNHEAAEQRLSRTDSGPPKKRYGMDPSHGFWGWEVTWAESLGPHDFVND